MKFNGLVIPAALAAALAVAAFAWWRGDGASTPELASAPVMQDKPVPPYSTVAATTEPLVQPRAPASAASAPRPAPDVSRMQREIQIAVSSDQRGKAGEAARHIKTCESVERVRAQIEAGWNLNPDADGRTLLTGMQQDLASCQAVDAASRAQLVPLLRRSLAEDDKGAAASLLAALGKDFDVAAESDLVAALRRDAWACDRVSLSWLSTLATQHPHLLTPDELGALREQQRAEISKATEAMRSRADIDPAHKAAIDSLLASFKPPAGANVAEVAHIAADIQSRCKAER